MSASTLIFLTRAGCHLCDQARPVVTRAARRAGMKLEEIDIDGDDDLLGRFHLRVPVLLGPGEEVLAEGRIEDAKELARALRGSRRRPG